MAPYTILADGCRTSLTAEEIAELFYQGQITRDTPCKHLGKPSWQTVDELFALLKYSAHPTSDLILRQEPSRGWLALTVICLMIVIIAGGLVLFDVRSRHVQQQIATVPTTVSRMQQFRSPHTVSLVPPNVSVSAENATATESSIATQQLPAQQSRSEQAARADEMRATFAQQEVARRRAAGTNVIVPLDETTAVNVGGTTLNVRIHDNDVASFDVWVNGRHSHEVPKQKGISGSRTDETLIYHNARASLYYVWELSGELNHCLLRVRDE